VLDRVAAALATSSTRPPLTVVADQTTIWAWFAADRGEPINPATLLTILGDVDSGVRASIGCPAQGAEGFRATHEQALRAQAVAIASGRNEPTVTTFREAGLASFLNADIAAAKFWVEDVLGRLAADDDASARLRETSRVFLETNGSFTETAARLHLHKNTVLYRVRKAEELRGRPLSEDRIAVEVALLACAQLGSAVLQPADGD
jgi:DNA-binding PucR family transcriptional regulator